MASIKVRLKVQDEILHGDYPITIQIIHHLKKRVIHTGYTSREQQWNFETHSPNSKHPNSAWLDGYLKDRIAKAQNILLQLEMRGKPYTVDQLLEKITTKTNSQDVVTYIKSLIIQLENEGKIGNSKVYKSLVGILNLFLNEQSIDFIDLDYRKLKKFEEFLLKRSVKANTLSYYMRTLRAVYNRAIKEGVVDEALYPFRTYKITSSRTQKRAISKEQITKIRDVNLNDNDSLCLARDIFMWSFYTRGMNLVDIIWLKVKDIKNNRVVYTRKKTKQPFTVALIDPALKIMRKYDNSSKTKDSYVFPIIQRKDNEYLDYLNYKRLINKHLKKVAALAKIDVELTTYVARHTWATHAKYMGVETAKISEALGHTTEEITQTYLDSFDNATIDDINKLVTL